MPRKYAHAPSPGPRPWGRGRGSIRRRSGGRRGPHHRQSGPRRRRLHPLGPEPNFNESMYFNFFDTRRCRSAASCRLGNRANEGYAEVTVCLYLPDGRVLFNFKRPEIREQRRLRRGRHALRGARADRAPAHALYEGHRARARRPARDGGPGAASARTRSSASRIDLLHEAVGPALRQRAGQAGRRKPAEQQFAPRPLRAAHARDRHASRSRASATRSTASACATTPGARATGRRSTPTSGSR